ncbi:hypothetical protein ACVTKY_004393 [Klebsiella michiganensis]
MFSNFAIEFMAKNMKITVSSIESKLNEDLFASFRSKIVDAIEYYIVTIHKFELSGGVRNQTGFEKNAAEKDIFSYHESLSKSLKDEVVKSICDSLRHAFCSYASGGIHQLYSNQENGNWYPEIILTEILTPNDIDSLNETLTLYRGCDIGELESKEFRQAWTTSLNVAEHFAYTNYLGYDGFDINKRVVLETTYPKEHVLFSKQSVEYEVVINTRMLGCVRKHS